MIGARDRVILRFRKVVQVVQWAREVYISLRSWCRIMMFRSGCVSCFVCVSIPLLIQRFWKLQAYLKYVYQLKGPRRRFL